jgi:hypothetical protein
MERTCTAGFTAELLAHVPVLPPRVASREIDERLESVEPLAKVAGGAVVLTVMRRQVSGSESAGSLELSLGDVHGGWLVSSLRVLS